MKKKPDKDEIAEMVRLWDVPKIMETLAAGVAAEDMVNGKRGDVLLLSILNRSEPMFLNILSRPFDFKKNDFTYFSAALSNASAYKDNIYIKTLLSHMSYSDLQQRAYLTQNTYLHLACEAGHQGVAMILSKRGLSWEAVNKLHQTPLHILLRKVPYLHDDVLDDIAQIKINKKDKTGISCRDIIASYSLDPEWSAFPNNQKLLTLFGLSRAPGQQP